MITFHSLEISISNYFIRNRGEIFGKSSLENWVLEGSNDKIHWEMIDSRKNDTSLNNNHSGSLYECQVSQPFSHIRLKQIEKDDGDWENLRSSFLEFSGRILPK
jgi:hypothetical protein